MRLSIPWLLIALVAPAVSRADRVIAENKTTVSIDCGKQPIVQVIGNANTVRTSGRCKDVVVDGNDNHVVVAASAHVSLRGNHNELELAAVDALDALGNENQVRHGPGTKVSDLGTGNSIGARK